MVFRWAAFLVCWGTVLYGMFAPQAAIAFAPRVGDLVLHFTALGLMAVTAQLALVSLPRSVLWSCLLVLAIVLESTQSVVQPSRHFSFADMGANVGGVVAAGVLCWAVVWCRGGRLVE
jgi:hypothetical protein